MKNIETLLNKHNFTIDDVINHKRIYKGDVFSRLTVLLIVRKRGKDAKVVVRCVCGNFRLVAANSLLRKLTLSCGCYNKELIIKANTDNNYGAASATHGMSKTNIYNCWANLKDRCTNKNKDTYHRYGGRGITFDPAWNDFENFYKDMGKSYFEYASLDRINNDGNYCKDNCQWLTKSENSVKGAS